MIPELKKTVTLLRKVTVFFFNELSQAEHDPGVGFHSLNRFPSIL